MVVEERLRLGPQLRETLSRITEEAAQLLAVEGAGLRLVVGGELVRVATYGPEGSVMARERLGLGESLSGRVAASGQPLILAGPEGDPTGDPVYRARAEQHGFRSWLGVPLRDRERVVGVLVMQSRTERRFGPTDVRLLEAFAGQAAVAIENARLFEHERERRRQLEAVREVTTRLAAETDLAPLLELISRLVTELLEVDSVAVYLLDEASGTLIPRAWHGYGEWLGALRIAPGEGVAGTILQHGSGLIANDYRAFPQAHPTVLERSAARAVVGEPLLYEGELRGVITAAIHEEGRTFGEQDRQLLALFATQAAIAIQHARLHAARDRAMAEVDAARERAAFLAESGAVLASSLDYQATIQQAARLAVPTLADWCTVYALTADGDVRRVAVACDDEQKAGLAEALRAYPPTPLSPRSSVAEVMRTGRPAVIPDIPDDYVAAIARDAPHLEIMRQLAFRSSLVVPLRARDEVLGAMALFTWDERRRFGQADLPLAEDLAHRVAVAIDNARLYQEARRAIQLRDEFLSDAAHELKTPITSLLGYAQVLQRHLRRETRPEDGVVSRALAAIEQQSVRLSRLVSQLLDISRVQDGHLTLDLGVTDLVPLLRAMVAGAQIGTTRHTLVVHAPDEMLAVVDGPRLEQVLANLLDNAIKYSPDGGLIEVEGGVGCRVSGVGEEGSPARNTQHPTPSVRIAVRDRGIGIPPERRQHIFDRFFQAHASDHRSGLGLGLYISRQIVELHGGSIDVEFPSDGGTRFMVSLPTGPAAAEPARVAEAAS
jgi:signal transduction histidine kinase